MSKTEGQHRESESPAYREAIQWLLGRTNFERISTERYSVQDFKLTRMRELLRRLGDPQDRLPCVHLTGTKGKGSTAAMIASIVRAAGKKVALFTSPHIDRYEERLTINGVQPSCDEIVALVAQLRPLVTEMDGLGGQGPTFFEITTALAWLHFLHHKVDLAVMEVGLGGRLDSTNICRPLVCLLTSISRDHTRLLGETFREIAGEKAGIVKPKVPLICGELPDDASSVVMEKCTEAEAPVFRLGQEILLQQVRLQQAQPDLPACASFKVSSPWQTHRNLAVRLPGAHQARNAALAVAATDYLNTQGWNLSAKAVSTGLQNCDWPMRVEVISRHPLVIVDSAHNDASISALCESLAEVTARHRIAIFGTSRDKEAAAMLQLLDGRFDEILLTKYLHNPRATPVAELAQFATNCVTRSKFRTTESPAEAWQLATTEAAAEDLICFTGSFYLAAEARAIVLPAS